MEKDFFTLSDIAKKLKIPESNARYYRDRFIEYIPFVGEGRQRRYKSDAIEVLRLVAEGYKRNLTTTDIETLLSQRFPRTVEVTQQPKTTTQQEQNLEVNQGILQAFQQMASAMEVMSKQQEDISELKKKVADLMEERHLQDKYIEEKLEERDRKLMASLRETQQSSFFKRLFGK
jgi:DNA-binding transcriptional MerR regulator